jgi:8-oxo-dGTP diphosphatase
MVEAELFALAIESLPMPAAEIEEMIWLDPGSAHDAKHASLTRDVVLRRHRT